MSVVLFVLSLIFALIFGIWLACEVDSKHNSYKVRLAIGLTGLFLVVYCFVCSFLFSSIRHWWYATSTHGNILYYDIPTSKCKELGIELAKEKPLYLQIYYACDKKHNGSCGQGFCNGNIEYVKVVFLKKTISDKYDALTTTSSK